VNVVRVELPPLRRRKEDIPVLADQFIARFNRLQQKTIPGISTEALSLLMAHDWPGNVRELENVIERSFIMCAEGVIDVRHLPAELTSRSSLGPVSPTARSAQEMFNVQLIRAALERNKNNRCAAAKELGMHKTTLFRKMRKLGIAVTGKDGRSFRTGKLTPGK